MCLFYKGETKIYPIIQSIKFGEVTIDDKTYTRDLYIRADGSIKRRKKKLAKELYGTSHSIGPEELKILCKKKPEILIIGTGHDGCAGLTKKASAFLQKQAVGYELLPSPEAVQLYNRTNKKKALLLHLTC